jgi:predicted aspartyl protease
MRMIKSRGSDICRCFFGMCLMLAASAVVAEDCRLERVAAVEMTISKDGQVQIPVEINGTRVQMGVDVGGGLSAIWSGAVAALNLQPKDSIARGRLNAGAIPLTQTVELSGLKIANTQWLPFGVLVFPRNKVFPESLSADDSVGFLGQTAFANLDLELDFQAHQLRLYSQNHCAGAIVYWASRYDVVPLQKSTLGNLFISMAVNGRLMSTSMSTMSQTSRLEEEAARSILGIDRTSIDANGSDGCSHCQSITLKAEGLEIRNAQVRIVNSVSNNCRLNIPRSQNGVASYNCPGAYPLQLGVDVLSKLHLYYANAQKKLYFTDADAKMAGASAEAAISESTTR